MLDGNTIGDKQAFLKCLYANQNTMHAKNAQWW